MQCAGPVGPKLRLPMDLDTGEVIKIAQVLKWQQVVLNTSPSTESALQHNH